MLCKRPEKKQYALKLDIKTQSCDINNETVLIYIPISKTGSEELLLKFLLILKNIMKGQNLAMGPQMYDMTKKLLVRESL